MVTFKKKRLASVCFGLLASVTLSYAQTIIPDDDLLLPEPNGKVQVTPDRQPIVKPIGNLRSTTTYTNTIVAVDEKDGQVYNIIPGDPSQMAQRLRAIEGEMPMVYNYTVSQFIDFFMRRRPSFTKSMLEKKDFYFPVFEKYLAKYNMPDELKYLAMIESGLNPKAISRASAAGLWQFMSFTGREQGLLINDYVDERMHIEKSTDAACRYLRTLYGMFHDWELALAAYNSGPGTIRRALRRSGRTNYWDIHSFIPSDTRTYVPQWTAIAYMMNYASDHNIFAENILYPIDSKPFYVNGYMNLPKLAEMTSTPYETIQLLNPHIKVDVLPPHTRNLEVRLPLTNYAYFEGNRQAILATAGTPPYVEPVQVAAIQPETHAGNSINGIIAANEASEESNEEATPVEPTPAPTPVRTVTVPVKKTITKYHKVRSGENLTEIADRYNVYIGDIKDWNHLRSSKIMVGQRLKIQTTVTQQVTKEAARTVASSKTTTPAKVGSSVKYYTVKPGDTLWSISQRYGGVSINDIKRMNNLKGNTVKVGQRLKISNQS